MSQSLVPAKDGRGTTSSLVSAACAAAPVATWCTALGGNAGEVIPEWVHGQAAVPSGVPGEPFRRTRSAEFRAWSSWPAISAPCPEHIQPVVRYEQQAGSTSCARH
jgi:hypothetical protein